VFGENRAVAGFAHNAELQIQRIFISHHTGAPHRAAVFFSAHQQRRIELISPSLSPAQDSRRAVVSRVIVSNRRSDILVLAVGGAPNGEVILKVKNY
jgi:hypothetical protein